MVRKQRNLLLELAARFVPDGGAGNESDSDDWPHRRTRKTTAQMQAFSVWANNDLQQPQIRGRPGEDKNLKS
jgi:hypothetical protein